MPNSLNINLETSRKTAAYLFSQDKTNPLSYRLNRTSLWLGLTKLPQVSGGNTLLPAPDKTLMPRLDKLKENGEFEAIVTLIEGDLHRHLFWFDLHFKVAEALGELDSSFSEAQETVLKETAGFVNRLPGIDSLSFSDGQPFAEDETKAWLKSFSPGAQNEVSFEPTAQSDSDKERKKVFQDIKKKLKGKKMGEGLTLYHDHLGKLSSHKEKLLWKLEMADALLKTKNRDFLSMQIEMMVQDCDRFQLDEFEPTLALQVFGLAATFFRKSTDPDAKKKTQNVLARIAKIDLNEYARFK